MLAFERVLWLASLPIVNHVITLRIYRIYPLESYSLALESCFAHNNCIMFTINPVFYLQFIE